MVSRAQYHFIKAALTSTEKDIIHYFELQWHLRQYVPTLQEIVDHINTKYEKERKTTKLKYTALNYYLNRAPVKKALRDRGIPFEQHTQDELTPQQMAAAITVMNFADERSTSEKLDQLGLNESQYYAWLNDPTFNNFVNSLADQNKVNIRPAAVAEFSKLIHKGDWNAIKYYLDITGEFKSSETPQSEVLIRMFVEIIQRHVKDPDIITAIAMDVKLAAANRTLEVVTQPQISATAVSDEEIVEARKKLGV